MADDLTVSERAELERLRVEVRDLRSGQPPSPADTPRRPRGGWPRTTAAVVLVTVGCLLAPLAVAAVWAESQVGDTERYVETVVPLADDPALQDAVTAELTDLVFEYLDVTGITTQAFGALADASSGRVTSDQLAPLVTPVANGIRSFTADQVGTVVRSDAFATAWTEANRAVHQQLVAALSGEGDGAVEVENGTVSVDLGSVVTTVQQRLLDRGFELAERIPVDNIDASFVILQSDDIASIQRGYSLLDTLGLWLPLVCLALLALGIYVARGHRRALVAAGIGLCLAMLVFAVALALARSRYLDAVPASALPTDAAASLFDTVVRFLREAVRAVAVLGAVVAVGAFLLGPSVTATRTRQGLAVAVDVVRRGVEALGLPLARVRSWVGPRRRVLRTTLVVAAGLVIFFWPSYRGPELVLWCAVGVLVGLFLVQLLGAEPRTPLPSGPDEVLVGHAGEASQHATALTGTQLDPPGQRSRT